MVHIHETQVSRGTERSSHVRFTSIHTLSCQDSDAIMLRIAKHESCTT